VSWHTHKIRGSRNRNRERETETPVDLDDPREIQIANGYLCWNRICDVNELQPNREMLLFPPILCFGNREKQRMKQSSVLERFRYKSQREREIWLLEQRVDVVPRCEVRGPWRSLVPLFFFFFLFSEFIYFLARLVPHDISFLTGH